VALVIFSDSESAPIPKIFESGSGSKDLQIWEYDYCLDSGYHRCNRNSATFLLKKCHIWKPHWLVLLKMKSDSGSRSGVSQIFNSGSGSERKRRILPESTPAPRMRSHLWCRPFWHTKNWVIGFVFSITTRSASVSAVALFRLLEPLSYARFDILKLMQVSLLLIHRYPDYFEKKKKTYREAHLANEANKLMLQIGLTNSSRFVSDSTVVKIFFYALSCRRNGPRLLQNS